jgi:hypothetical protein
MFALLEDEASEEDETEVDLAELEHEEDFPLPSQRPSRRNYVINLEMARHADKAAS